MFKKIVLIGASFVFALGVLGTSVYRVSAETVSTLEVVSETEASGSMEESQNTVHAQEAVDYPLTWPGLLPDHFLYPIKMVRDRLLLFFTTNPLKKAELLLKLADKRVWAAKMLLDKEKEELASTTATKAERYLERAHDQAKLAQENGQDVSAFFEKLSLASRKHEEVLVEAGEKATGSAREAFKGTLEYPRKVYQQVTVFLNE